MKNCVEPVLPKVLCSLVTPENSAQGTHFPPNRFVVPILRKLVSDARFGLPRHPKIVDLGCGKLRHLSTLLQFSKDILLVDTRTQIDRKQKLGKKFCTIDEYVASLGRLGNAITVQPVEEFERSRHNADVILSVAVMDAVLKEARTRMTTAAFLNLRPGGCFVIIVPRNDSSILVNCGQHNMLQDGHYFRNRGHNVLTFYTNYRDPGPLRRLVTKRGFTLVDDCSVYRYLCLIFRKQTVRANGISRDERRPKGSRANGNTGSACQVQRHKALK